MKNPILIFILFPFAGFGQHFEPDLPKMDFKGKVKSVEIRSDNELDKFEIASIGIVPNQLPVLENFDYTFDKNGYKTKEVAYTQNLDLRYTWNMTYNDNGYLTEEKTTNELGETVYHFVNRYRSDNQIDSIIYYPDIKNKHKTYVLHEYDERDSLKMQWHKTESGKVFIRSFHLYDKKQNSLTYFSVINEKDTNAKYISFFDKKNQLIRYQYGYDDTSAFGGGMSTESFKYKKKGLLKFSYHGSGKNKKLYNILEKNEAGLIIRNIDFWDKHICNTTNSVAKIDERYHSYNDSGQVIMTRYKSDDYEQIDSSFYDDNGLVIKKNSTNILKNQVSFEQIISRNEHGNPIRVEFYSAGKKNWAASSTFEYEYDNKGNWIKRSEYRKGILVAVTNRKIRYFD
ncbi:hypothetical protein K6119_07640 [Paracrocinitomix mangrovi]|uniref:hypothetical protein n=1 Tax=Paracrocinitomix mangrovi TaxID=2862509 RepID=UPI001C8DCDA9|nr:hypothetical protein [Paracrocinitomix mangrovi]UKN03387.1 hypothetical protein K6119_07640 [Paracrocinitomix mangrovi]